MDNQEAKHDAGKLQISYADSDSIKVLAELNKYEYESEEQEVPKLICKTRKQKGQWKGLFVCPYN